MPSAGAGRDTVSGSVSEFDRLPPTAVMVRGYERRETYGATVTVMIDVTVPTVPGVGDEELNVALMPVIESDLALRETAESNPLTDVRKTFDTPDAPAATRIEAGSDAIAKSGPDVGEVKYSAVIDTLPVAVIVTGWILPVTLSFHLLKNQLP
jgi:hypothetical protein